MWCKVIYEGQSIRSIRSISLVSRVGSVEQKLNESLQGLESFQDLTVGVLEGRSRQDKGLWGRD